MFITKRNDKLHFYMDVSGTPPAKTCFALVSFNVMTKDKLIDDFFNLYPQYEEKKGRELTFEEHINIINYFNQNNVRMVVFSTSNNEWSFYKKKYGRAHEYKERLCAVIYTHLFNRMIKDHTTYDVTSCIEKQWGDIHRVFHHCSRLITKMRKNTKINVDYGFSKNNDGLKIADFMAYSARFTIELKKTEEVSHYHVLDKHPPDWFFKVIFS